MTVDLAALVAAPTKTAKPKDNAIRKGSQEIRALAILKAHKGKGPENANLTVAELAPKMVKRDGEAMDEQSFRALLSKLFAKLTANGVSGDSVKPSDYVPGEGRGRRAGEAIGADILSELIGDETE